MFDPERKKKTYSTAEAYLKIRSYCAYQERSHKEVRNKLFEYGLHTNAVEEIISKIITDGFLNEERFARAFAGGKFRMKKWGKNKIVHELEALGITPRCIRAGLKEIDDADYRKTLREMIRKKLAQTHEANAFKKRDKVARFVIGKGYEPESVWEIIRESAE